MTSWRTELFPSEAMTRAFAPGFRKLWATPISLTLVAANRPPEVRRQHAVGAHDIELVVALTDDGRVVAIEHRRRGAIPVGFGIELKDDRFCSP